MDAFTDEVINNNSYRFGRMKADEGSWLVMRFMKQIMELLKNTPDATTPNEEDNTPPSTQEKAAQAINAVLLNLDELLFKRVQAVALSCVSRHTPVGTTTVPLPIVQQSTGRFTVPDLETDIETIMKLTSASLLFNLTPFFETGVFNSLLAKI